VVIEHLTSGGIGMGNWRGIKKMRILAKKEMRGIERIFKITVKPSRLMKTSKVKGKTSKVRWLF